MTLGDAFKMYFIWPTIQYTIENKRRKYTQDSISG